MELRVKTIVAACSLALMSSAGFAAGTQTTNGEMQPGGPVSEQAQGRMNPQDHAASKDERSEAQDDVRAAVDVVQNMKSDPDLSKQMDRAKGILIVPHFFRGAIGIGGRGGDGVLMSRQDGTWGNPVFYNLGGVSIGAQAGASGGSIAFLLMTDKAVDAFKGNNNFSLNAEAGISVVNWSAMGQASTGKDDVIAWSDTKGLYAGATISATDVNYDGDTTAAYYGVQKATPEAVMSGEINNPHENPLKDALAST